MAKNAPTAQSEHAPKRVKMAKNDQKSAQLAKLDTTRALDLPAGGTLAKRRPLCVDGDCEKTACE